MTIGYDRHFIDGQDVPLPTLGPAAGASRTFQGKGKATRHQEQAGCTDD